MILLGGLCVTNHQRYDAILASAQLRVVVFNVKKILCWLKYVLEMMESSRAKSHSKKKMPSIPTELLDEENVCIQETNVVLSSSDNPSAPSAPPLDLTDCDQTQFDDPGSPVKVVALPEIRPFTERQLLALYLNHEIHVVAHFVDAFLLKEKGLYFNNCPLNDLLNDYLRSRLALNASESTLKHLRSSLRQKEDAIWSLHDKKVENEGSCHDKVKVVSVHKFQVAEFNASAVSMCNKLLKEIKEELFERLSLCLFKTNKWKLRIDNYINEISCHQIKSKDELKTCISVLFSFQRKVIGNEVFVRDTRYWLDVLVATLLQSQPTFEDHLFLLNHVLRCPGGVGHWAAAYVQPPGPTFSDDEEYLSNSALNELMALLSTLFSPVKGRKEMLREYCLPASDKTDDPWVVLDSDGDDDGTERGGEAPLRENDYVAILNQFPIESVFKYILKIEKGIEVYDKSQCMTRFTTTSFIKLFAFSTQFVNLLKSGLQHFSSPCYRQLAKRLGRLVRHSLQYVSDHWSCFLSMHTGKPEEKAMIDKIEVEYNHFFLRAIKSIFHSSANSGMWQYLAAVPYGTVTETVLWRAYAIFHFIEEPSIESLAITDDPCAAIQKTLINTGTRASFEETLTALPDTEVLFLLTTFANMAMTRSYANSKLFICQVTSELVSVGFINSLTSDSCAKGCRDLLSNISSTHPQMLSHLVHLFEAEPCLVNNTVYINSGNSSTVWTRRANELSKLRVV